MDQSDNNTEMWKPVLGWEGVFEVSSVGRLRRISGGTAKGITSPRLLHPKLSTVGYYVIDLKEFRSIHSLVATAFLGPKPKKTMVCNHKNGIKTDNRIDNLEWVTHKENSQHSVRLGLTATGDAHWTKRHPELINVARGEEHYLRKYPEKVRRGSRIPSAKLTEVQVVDIKRRLALGELQGDVATIYGCSDSNISAIASGKSWRHII